MTQFHITCWAPDGQCSNLKAVVDVIEEVAKVQRRIGSKPVFVHCRYLYIIIKNKINHCVIVSQNLFSPLCMQQHSDS